MYLSLQLRFFHCYGGNIQLSLWLEDVWVFRNQEVMGKHHMIWMVNFSPSHVKLLDNNIFWCFAVPMSGWFVKTFFFTKLIVIGTCAPHMFTPLSIINPYIFWHIFFVTRIAVLRTQVCLSAEWIRLHSASRFYESEGFKELWGYKYIQYFNRFHLPSLKLT